MVHTSYFKTMAHISVVMVVLLLGFVADGKAQIHDTDRTYYPNGQVYYCTPKLNGRHHGTTTSYYPNGKLKGKGDWKNGKLVGKLYGYFEDGSIQEKGSYSNGQLVNLKTYYSENKLKTTYHGTPETNRSKYWDENGQLLQKQRFKHYKPISCSTSLILTTEDSVSKPPDVVCFCGKVRVYPKNGIMVDENDNPIQSKKCRYKIKEWHSNGQLKSIIVFKKQKLTKKEWDVNGIPIPAEIE